VLVALTAALALGPGAAVAAAPATGVIAQKHGRAGCISSTGARGACARGRAFARVRGIAISADGKSAYVASPIDGLAVLDRAAAGGALTQKAGRAGCVRDDGHGCTQSTSAGSEYAVVVSADGRSVYSAGLFGVSVFDRDPASGALEQKAGDAGCFDAEWPYCTPAPSIDFPDAVAISPDGLNLYVGSLSHSVTVFDRDATGALRAKAGRDGCLSANGSGGRCARGGFPDVEAITISPDGHNLYVASASGITVFDRAPGGALRRKPGPAGCVTESGSRGRCANGKALKDASSTAISSDGRSLYVTSVASHAVAVFDRDPATGALAQKRGRAGCFSDSGTGGRCTNAKALRAAAEVAISPDGLSVYVAGIDAVSTFDRNATTGTLRQKRGRAGCVADGGLRGICAAAKALRWPDWLAVGPEGGSVYVGTTLSNSVAIFDRRLPAGR
jgi:DNA-binding beta-propeller fold protein YncE